MKKIFIALFVLLAVLIAGVFALPSLVPSSVYKEKIESQLSEKLARDVRILGDIKLRAFPVIKAETGRVEISNPNGFTADNLASMNALSARIKVLPLLSKRVEIASFTLVDPEINLEKMADGRANWELGGVSDKPKTPTETGPFKRDGRYADFDSAIGKFALENGTISYIDKGANTAHTLSNVTLDFELPSLSSPLELEGELSYNDTPASVDVTLNNIRAFLDGKTTPIAISVATDFAQIKADGQFLAGEDIAASVKLDGDVSDLEKLLRLAPIDLDIGSAISELKLDGVYKYDEGILSAKGADISVNGPALTASFQGDALLKNPPSFSGRVVAKSLDVQALRRALPKDLSPTDLQALEIIQTVNASANLETKGDGFIASDINATANGQDFTASYTGTADIAQSITANGGFTASASSLPSLVSALKIDMPQAATLGAIDLSGDIALAGERVDINALTARLTGGQVNGGYDGTLSLDNGVSLGGMLSLDVPSMRAAAQTLGSSLPPSTPAGETFGPFSITGQVTGSPDALDFTDAKISFDDMSGTGTFGVDLTPATPYAKGALEMQALDLRPYMPPKTETASRKGPAPWSTDPIDLSFLKSIDGDFTITSPSITTPSVNLGQSSATAKLRAGVLTADIPNVSLYGGLGRITAIVNASGSIPTVSLEAGLDDLNSNQFLTSIANFTKATGQGATLLKISGQGTSQAQIIQSLSGGGDFKLTDGQISGVDLSELLTGLEQAIQSRSLPGGIGQSYATQFNDIIGLFTIENGVITVDDFSLSGLGVLAEGSGEIDLGGQNIDFRLRPRLTGEDANDLAASGIPLKFTGGFGSASAGLDTELLGDIVAARARAEGEKLIREKVSDQLGGITDSVTGGVLDSILGNQTQPDSESADSAQSETETETEIAETAPVPQVPSESEIVTDVLGGLFGLGGD